MSTLSSCHDAASQWFRFDDPMVIRERVNVRPSGRLLEGHLGYPAHGPVRWAVLLAGPHPLLGGQQRNNVVQAMQTAFAARGAAALAFDYSPAADDTATWLETVSQFWRESSVPQERLWVEDADGMVASLRRWCTGPVVLAGYSFGAWVVARIAQRVSPRAIVLISPNPKQHSFDDLRGVPADLLVIHSDNDFACPIECLVAWFGGLRDPKVRVMLAGGEHFFRGRESAVVHAATAFLATCGLGGQSA